MAVIGRWVFLRGHLSEWFNSSVTCWCLHVSAYGIGLIITFIALALMKTGQPALLYLVPCTLGTTYLIGLKRKEVKMLWSGAYQVSLGDLIDFLDLPPFIQGETTFVTSICFFLQRKANRRNESCFPFLNSGLL